MSKKYNMAKYGDERSIHAIYGGFRTCSDTFWAYGLRAAQILTLLNLKDLVIFRKP